MATARQNRAARKSIAVGAVVIVFFLALLLFGLTATNGLPEYAPGVERNTVKVAFTDVGSLRQGDDARISNLRAGFVDEIVLEGDTPIVTVKLDENRPVYSNATAQIRDRSVLGQKYVDVNPGTPDAGLLPPGQVLAAERNQDVKELSVLLNVFDEPTREGLASTFREVGGGLMGRSQDLSDGFGSLQQVLPGLGTVASSLASNEGKDLSGLLQTADRLARAFEGRQEEIGRVVGQFDRTFAAFNADGGEPLAATLQKAPVAFVETRAALDSLNQPLASTGDALRDIQPGAESLGAATGDVRDMLRASPGPLYRLSPFAEAADPALESLQPTMEDIDPVVKQLRTTFDRAEKPLGVLAPYSAEIQRFFTNAADALREGDGDGNWIRVQFYGSPESVNQVPIQDPTISRDPYPAPGEARKQQERSPIGERSGG